MSERQCRKCKNFYECTSQFFKKHKECKNGLDHICKNCCRKRDEKWRFENQEYIKQWKLNNYEYLKNWHAERKENSRERVKEWRKNNKEKLKELTRNSRARRKNAEGKHTKEDIQKLLIEQDYKCKYCLKDITNNYHVDHVIPLSKGGSNYVENLCIACPTCNLSKHNRMPDEWLCLRKG